MKLLALLIVALSLVSAKEDQEETITKCQKENDYDPSSGPSNTEKYKKYMLCLFRGLGIVDESDNIDEEKMESYFPDDRELAKKKCSECLKKYEEEEDILEKVYLVSECVRPKLKN